MEVGRQIAWFGLGFCAVTVLGVMTAAGPAGAQGTGASATTIVPPPRAQPATPRRNGLPTPFDPNAAEPVRRNSAVPVTVPDELPAEGVAVEDGGEGSDADGARPPILGQRPTLRDGDPNAQQGPAQEPDGVFATGEPRGPQDGADGTLNDTRSPDEIAVFENPPAGFDPQLFQVEIEPILDRRPERLFRFEPFEARGIRVGTFVLLPEAEFGATHVSNVFRAANRRADVAFDVRPSARLVSNWRTHALEFRATGNLSRFSEFTSEGDRAYTLETRGLINLSKRTSFEALAARDLTQDRRSSINAQVGATDRADITTDRFAAALNHRFNRLSVQLRGSLTDARFGANTASGGGTLANNDRDIQSTEQAVRATWEVKPTLFTFIETAVNQRAYKAAASTDGIRRDSDGERHRIGVSFGNEGQRVRGELSVGHGRQHPDDRQLRTISGLLVDANLAYRYSALTSFLLSAKSDVTETKLANSGGAFSRQVGFDIRHGFRRDLIGTAGLAYTVQDFEGLALLERELTATAGLEYFVNREIIVFSRYQHTAFNSTDSSRNYGADEFRVGMRIRR